MKKESDHERYIRRCIDLARIARNNGNTPVGSVIVLDNEIIGEGVEQLPAGDLVTGHAEVLACQQAVERLGTRNLRGAVAYSTAEPCFMCSYVLRHAEITLVVYGVETPMIGGATSSFPILTSESLNHWKAAVEVVRGVLAEECRELARL